MNKKRFILAILISFFVIVGLGFIGSQALFPHNFLNDDFADASLNSTLWINSSNVTELAGHTSIESSTKKNGEQDTAYLILDKDFNDSKEYRINFSMKVIMIGVGAFGERSAVISICNKTSSFSWGEQLGTSNCSLLKRFKTTNLPKTNFSLGISNITNNATLYNSDNTINASVSLNNLSQFYLSFFTLASSPPGDTPINETIYLYNFTTYNFSDSTPPNLTIIAPNTTYTSITNVPVNITALDDWQLDYCYFNVTRGASLEVSNTEIKNCINTTFTVSGDANYIIHIFVNDTSGNNNCSNASFSTINYIPPSSSSSSGGGGYIVEKLTDPIQSKVCKDQYPPFKEAWENFKENKSWENFKIVWYAYFSYTLCEAGASLIPT